jgi:hypothetical protein
LAPCDFLFSKIKLKLKGRRFDTIEEIQADSQRVLETLTENDFQKAFLKKRRRWEETTSRVMAANRPYGEFQDFYSISLEYIGYTLVLVLRCTATRTLPYSIRHLTHSEFFRWREAVFVSLYTVSHACRS